ncbi:hypothetical protein BS78_02G365600 [Paspalum vaginatum]|nr:hypothetical protein BS78_02G365600 [Paspalum vaginatum]
MDPKLKFYDHKIIIKKYIDNFTRGSGTNVSFVPQFPVCTSKNPRFVFSDSSHIVQQLHESRPPSGCPLSPTIAPPKTRRARRQTSSMLTRSAGGEQWRRPPALAYG